MKDMNMNKGRGRHIYVNIIQNKINEKKNLHIRTLLEKIASV